MVVKILGSGCRNCVALSENAKEALALLGIEADVVKITDFAEITAYGVMSTPALVIDEKVLSSGKVLKTKEIVKLIEKTRP